MKCLMCERLSLSHICPKCITNFLTPSIYKRKINNDIEVISFYKYKDIKNLLHTKHTYLGFYIYKILAQQAFAKFAKEFTFETTIVSIGIDDNIKSDYSHTAILNKALKSKSIKPLFSKIRSKNNISYSGKTKKFRMMNQRDFKLIDFNEENVILVDDIITTGSTLNQAIELLKQNNKKVLFCLTLA